MPRAFEMRANVSACDAFTSHSTSSWAAKC